MQYHQNFLKTATLTLLLLLLSLTFSACKQNKPQPPNIDSKKVMQELDAHLTTGPPTLIIVNPADIKNTQLTRWAAEALKQKLTTNGYAHFLTSEQRDSATPCSKVQVTLHDPTIINKLPFKPDIIITLSLDDVTLIEHSDKMFKWTYNGNTNFEIKSLNYEGSWQAAGTSQRPPITNVPESQSEINKFLAERWGATEAHAGYRLTSMLQFNQPKR